MLQRMLFLGLIGRVSSRVTRTERTEALRRAFESVFGNGISPRHWVQNPGAEGKCRKMLGKLFLML